MSERLRQREKRRTNEEDLNELENLSISVLNDDMFQRNTRQRVRNSMLSQPSTSRMTLNETSRSERASMLLSNTQTSRRGSTLTSSQILHENDLYQNLTQSQRKDTADLSEEMTNSLVGDVIRFLLIADQEKSPIVRADIIKAALPNHSKYYKVIMQRVSAMLKEVFGYNLIESSKTKYILVNTFANPGTHLLESNEKVETVLLFLVLTHIFMSPDRKSTQDNLFDFLTLLGIVSNNNYMNDLFGNVEYLLTTKFVKQGYISIISDKTESTEKYFHWGVRAENEISPRRVLEFMSKIHDGCPLNQWHEPYKYMLMMEQTQK